MKSYKKKIVHLTEARLKGLINETVAQLLTEDQAGKSIKAAKQLVMDRLNYSPKDADEFIRLKLRNDFPILRDKEAAKFILGVTRMFLDGQIRDAATIGKLNTTLKYVASDAHINEYDRNLNGMSAQELIDRFAKNVELDQERDRNEVSSMQFEGRSDYDIIRIDSFEQASQYGKYTNWCVTHSSDMFDSYTCNGVNQFYFCLKNGFESTPKEEGENCPLDEYGLSMIAVLVNENGSLVHCTCRWNHENNGDDNVMNTKEISQVIGMNFYDVFKPNGKWKEIVNNVMQMLKDGEDPEDIFDDCGEFYNGYAWVVLNGKENLIDTNGNLVSPNQWFDSCDNFTNGYAQIIINDKWNLIDTKGNLVYNKPINQWFDYCGIFNDGFVRVRLNGKWNLIDTKGNPVCDQWFDWCGEFYEGYARIQLNGKYNFINTKGIPLYNAPIDQWFDECDSFANGYAVVERNRKWNWIDTEGKLFRGDFNSLNQWFDDCGTFSNDYAWVKLNGELSWVNTEGNLYDFESLEPLGINVKTIQTNESIMNRLTNMIAEKVIRRIQR